MGFPIPDSGAVTEDTGVVGGQLITSGDIDYLLGDDTGQWTAETLTGAYGSQLVIDADGNWVYTANNADPNIQALNTGETLTEVFTVTSANGTSTITITINGLDEPPCFTKGTLIDTPHGPRAVESLRAGDLVLTRDNGPRKISWIGAREISAAGFAAFDRLRPICIQRDSFAPGVPDRDLLVSPMHRLLVRDPLAGLLFGQEEILCAAKLLVNGKTIYPCSVRSVTYFHMLFDTHEVVSAHNLPSESFYPGQVGLSAFEAEAREEVFRLFPDLRSLPESYGKAARYILRGYEGKLLGRHLGARPSLIARLENRAPPIRVA